MTEKRNLKELDKLENYLKKKGIEYQRFDEDGRIVEDRLLGERHQIRFYVDVEEQSVICQKYSYGAEQGLLEGMGTLFQNDYDSVTGWMTAYDIIDRIEKPAKYEFIQRTGHLEYSIDNLQDTVKDIFRETKVYIDYIVTEIQEDRTSLDKVKEELERLSKILSMD